MKNFYQKYGIYIVIIIVFVINKVINGSANVEVAIPVDYAGEEEVRL